MPGPAVQAVKELTTISHLPASMNGSPFLFATTLTAMMCGVVLGSYVVGRMGLRMYCDRKLASFKSVLFNFRLMMLLCGLAAVMACLPETLYLQMYGDPKVSESTQAAVMTGKRVADSLRIYVIIGWVGLLVMTEKYITIALMDINEEKQLVFMEVEDYPGLDRLWKPAVVFVTLSLVAMVFAFSKVYGA